MTKIEPSEELLELTRQHAKSILGTYTERRRIEDEWLAKIEEESNGSEWRASRLLNMAQRQVLDELNAETEARLAERNDR